MSETRYWRAVEDVQPELASVRGAVPAPALPGDAAAAPGENRRDFLKLAGFSLGAAALASCTPIPERQALPLQSQAEGQIPGVESWYATTCGGCPAGCGLLAKVRDGRPIKIEGNPRSPISQGAACAVGQATVLSLYDEYRLRGPQLRGRPASWGEVDAYVVPRLQAIASRGGGLALLTGTLVSPTSRALAADFLHRFPTARHVVHDAVSLAAVRQANRTCFGRPVVPHFRFDRARVIVGIEADFLATWLSPVEFARAYAQRRRPEEADGMARHYQFEAGLSLTGSNADRRIGVLPSEIGLVALALLARVSRLAGATPGTAAVPPCDPSLLDRVAADLWRHRGESLVVCGINDPALQTTVNQINALLGNFGATIDLDHPSWQRQGDDGQVLALLDALERGEIHGLVVWGANPAYDHPLAARFARALGNVALKVSLAETMDETAKLVDVVCPDHHFLESWGDAEPVAGSFGLRQPAIAPLFETRAAHETLLRWMGKPADPLAYLKAFWREQPFPRQDRWPAFDDFWDHALQDGGCELPAASGQVAADRAMPRPIDPAVLAAAGDAILAEHQRSAAARGAGTYEVRLYEKVGLRDGRQGNNPWLQELPDPVSRIAWGNYACLAPQLAVELGLGEGDVVSLRLGGAAATGPMAAVEVPIHLQPGQPRQAISLAVGYGRTSAGKVGNGVGANAFPFAAVRDGFVVGHATGARLTAAGRTEVLAAVQRHDSMEGRPIVLEASLSEFRRDPAAGHGERPPAASLWTERPPEGHSWGMAVDLTRCTGCAACVVACQAENNVAVVGRDEVARGREMHWIRIDRYFSGPPEAPETVYQPMMCQHCANAPCETVCPVLATVHSSDGINQQVYNRCVGTRYCANNCPYKVRRFNWFQYAHNDRFDYTMNSDLERMVLNPDVVVRSRGVMEKCSLCIQRIQAGKLKAEVAGEPLKDGAVQTACQQACPTDAIVFGDRHDALSEVSRRETSPRFYHVLAELNTRPAVGYLTRIRNLPDEEEA